jgi:hypothetical protein
MPLTGDRRSRERFGFIDQCTTITYNALRKHDPELMGVPKEKPKAMAAAA